jgi:hypothetical protein
MRPHDPCNPEYSYSSLQDLFDVVTKPIVEDECCLGQPAMLCTSGSKIVLTTGLGRRKLPERG